MRFAAGNGRSCEIRSGDWLPVPHRLTKDDPRCRRFQLGTIGHRIHWW